MLKISNTATLRKKPNKLVLGFFVMFYLFFVIHGFSQKTVEKSWEGTAFDTLEIISDEVFKIEIIAGDFSKIMLQATIAGENFESMNIGASEKDKVLTLKPSYRPYFTPKNDKLAAHKLLSIEMKIHIPEGMIVYVSSKLASIETLGMFQKLDVNLRDGQCILKEFTGNAKINTHLGDIIVFATSQVFGTALTKNGNVTNKLSVSGKYILNAESVNGNISLYKTPE